MEEIKHRINKIKKEREKYNLTIPAPISEENIEKFKKEFKKYFDLEIDPEYLNFLKICDGLVENGYQIFSSKNKVVNKVPYGIFENNDYFHDILDEFKNYILFASSGQDFFVYNKNKKQYELLDRYSGDVFNVFNSFNDMLLYILKLMLFEQV